MEVVRIYQTLEDRSNPEEVESNGPFSCRTNSAWLGPGYYFWESFIENAHWWGTKNHSESYVICEAVIEMDSSNCFDLVGNTAHLTDLTNAINLMKTKNAFSKSKLLVPRVLKFLIDNKLFEYSSIRAYPLKSKAFNANPSSTIFFKNNNQSYLDLIPPIQICVIDFKGMKFKDYKIVYPDHYVENIFI